MVHYSSLQNNAAMPSSHHACAFLIPTTMILLLFSVVGNLVQIAAATSRADVLQPAAGATMEERFELWMKEHERVYKDDAEKMMRLEIFKSNVRFIDSFNGDGVAKFKLAANQFADRTEDEFHSILDERLLNATRVSGSFGFAANGNDDVPERVDWRDQGAVTSVRNQRSCGACVVFAAVATVEAIHKITTGTLASLSEQYVMDCEQGDACKGQMPGQAYNSIKQAGGIASLRSYPYVGVDHDTCDKAKVGPVAATIKDFVTGPSYNETAMKLMVAQQPILALMEAGSLELRFYSGGGVFNGPCGKSGHAVAVIGYGAEADGTKYWLVKNSWGSGWGSGGIGKIAREANPPWGLCAIAYLPFYPTA